LSSTAILPESIDMTFVASSVPSTNRIGDMGSDMKDKTFSQEEKSEEMRKGGAE